ncbi:amino acid aminotransferase [Oleiagrimonas sp. MCCC 1A03011]|uniref:amino acid aminotransferase n=1 Tax=Oleiagrimonas sp. MCCC 1A03011 TaxID=1926883 RepID=UPI000DC29472|nr:amino acid aminotransferase [Oleiagrimonas sp. MCCC 1A03011]RAP57202.1 aromatic amino acid aminotransferase [Oleiagrimonas sp. MCCC 1A03011]
MSLFRSVTLAPRDPILGLNEAFAADTRPGKVNLGVGVYYDAEGQLPLMRAVREAERERLATPTAHGYLPIDGIAAYDAAVQQLLFGAEAAAVTERRVVTVQSLGGTGALKVGADFLYALDPSAKVAISTPSWANHRGIFENAGFEVIDYPYYDAARQAVDLDGLLAALDGFAPGTIVVLHACCHNPTGVDLDTAQWRQVVERMQACELVPFLDIAYQGFGDGIEPDAAAIRLFEASGLPMFVASSFSKSFSLYGERVGALSVVAASDDEARRVQSQLKRVVRTNYSNPPTYGAALVSHVLHTPALRAMWEDELGAMRERIRAMRRGLVARLAAHGATGDFGFIERQRGMFSYSGLDAAQVARLAEEFGIYAVSSGRICVAALNEGNLDTVAGAIAAVGR